MAGKSGLVLTNTTDYYYRLQQLLQTTVSTVVVVVLVVSTNPDFPAIQPRRDASQKLYKDLRFS